jgi:predicted dehydrogenase
MIELRLGLVRRQVAGRDFTKIMPHVRPRSRDIPEDNGNPCSIIRVSALWLSSLEELLWLPFSKLARIRANLFTSDPHARITAPTITMKNHSSLTRREFLRHASVFTAAAAAPLILPSGVLAANGQPGANDRIQVGFVGIGRQAGGLLQGLLKLPEARVVAFADVNLPRAQEHAAKHGAKAMQDFRQLLAMKDVDAIVTATPEQWRANICIPACQAGKDIYAEKPMSLTIHEGRLMVEAARKYKRVFQVGSQQRSAWVDIAVCEFIRKGGMGKISKAIVPNYPSPWFSALPAQPVPEGLDWDFWCGPAPLVPYNIDLYTPRANPGWLSFRPYSGGEMTGWGAHGFDMVQYALGMDDSGPVEVWTEGPKWEPPTYDKAESKKRGDELAMKTKVFWCYANGVVLEPGEAPGFGAIFHGEKGTMKVDRGRCESEPEEIAIDLRKQRPKGVNDDHMKNWLDCIKSRKNPNADVEIGHRSGTVCHLGNIAREIGGKLKWDPVKEIFPDSPAANALLKREHRQPWTLPDKV